MHPDALIKILRQSDILGPLSPDQLTRLMTNSVLITLQPGQMLFQQGEQGDTAYIVVEGELSVQSDFGPSPFIVGHIGPGNMVGEIAVFAQTTRNASLVAKSIVRLIRLERETLMELVHQSPQLAARIISQLGHNLDELNAKVAGLTAAAEALCAGTYDTNLLASLKNSDDKLGYLAQLLASLADEIVEKRTRTQEMQTAIHIQNSFLPPPFKPTKNCGVDIAAIMQPARHVGGDFYDYFFISDTHLALLVGDVSGKGVPAALFMSVCTTTLKTLVQPARHTGDILTQMNHILCKRNDEAMFVTVFIAIIDIRTGQMDYASAGHENVLIKSDDRPITPLSSCGPAIGLIRDATYTSRTFTGDGNYTLLLTTDGISEAFNKHKQVYGAQRLINMFQTLRSTKPATMIDALQKDLQSHVQDEPPSDDVTAVIMRYQVDVKSQKNSS